MGRAKGSRRNGNGERSTKLVYIVVLGAEGHSGLSGVCCSPLFEGRGGKHSFREGRSHGRAHTTTCARVTSENYYYRYLKGNDGKSCIWATISIWKVSVDDLDIPWQWNYNGMKEKEKKGSSNEYKTVKRRLFQRKIFPFDSYYFRIWFNYCTSSSERKKEQRIHSRMIERKMYRGDVGELSRNSTLLFPGTGEGRKIWRAHRLRDPLPLSRELEISLAQEGMGLKEQKLGQILATGIESRENLIHLRLGSLLSPISDIPLPSVLVANSLSRSSATLLYFIYIYILYGGTVK